MVIQSESDTALPCCNRKRKQYLPQKEFNVPNQLLCVSSLARGHLLTNFKIGWGVGGQTAEGSALGRERDDREGERKEEMKSG